MEYTSTLVERNGPPSVMMCTCVKDRKASMVPTTMRKKTVGEIMGSVTERNKVQPRAPSIRAASYSSSGTPCNAASKNRTLRPSSFQTVVMATEMRAQSGSCSQRMGVRPMMRIRSFMTPTVGENIHDHTTEAMAVDTAMVDMKIVR